MGRIKWIWRRFSPYFIIFFIIFMYMTFGKYGLLGLLIAILIIVLVQGIRNRKLFLFQLQRMEKVMWGKSLNKENWKKDEMKNTILKPTWRKEKK